MPNLLDYERTCAEFSWSLARTQRDGLPDGRGLNIAHAAVHEGMMRLREDGLEKVRRGLTSIAEIARVAGTR